MLSKPGSTTPKIGLDRVDELTQRQVPPENNIIQDFQYFTCNIRIVIHDDKLLRLSRPHRQINCCTTLHPGGVRLSGMKSQGGDARQRHKITGFNAPLA